jgi:hypothetical protein
MDEKPDDNPPKSKIAFNITKPTMKIGENIATIERFSSSLDAFL